MSALPNLSGRRSAERPRAIFTRFRQTKRARCHDGYEDRTPSSRSPPMLGPTTMTRPSGRPIPRRRPKTPTAVVVYCVYDAKTVAVGARKTATD